MLRGLMQQKISSRDLNTQGLVFHPVIHLPRDVPVFDFSTTYDPQRTLLSPFGMGTYDEVRPTMYTEPQFSQSVRNIHMGIDIAAPVGTSVHTFYEGEIFAIGVNALPQDYGPTIITRHELNGEPLYALYGHLSMDCLQSLHRGQKIVGGQRIGAIGAENENGGWNPHLHFQLSRVRPPAFDLPGVVSVEHRGWARRAFPDPRLVLGNLYP